MFIVILNYTIVYNNKKKLCVEPLLQQPDFSQPCILTTDASGFAIGGILSQGKIGKDKPITYASRSLNDTEIKYDTYEKETLAIIFCVTHFRPYLYGRKFTLVTDHKPLVWFQNSKDSCSRVSRWRLKLAEYDFYVIYKAGKINVNADTLSRNPINDNTEKLKYLQVDDHDTFMTSQGKMFPNKTFARNKQENSENEVKPSKRRNLNPIIVPDDVDHFSEISEAQILNIDSKIPEFFQDFLSQKSFNEIGENILKGTNLFKSLSSILIFMTTFLLSPVFAKIYENSSWKTITTRSQKKRQRKK